MTKSILTLPPELLEAISSFLDANDLKNFGLSCKILYGIISNDLIWQNYIARRYKIQPDQYPDSSARAFYQHILHPYAPLIGLWIMEFKDYGGLLRVFVENGCLIGQEMFANLSLFKPLDTKRIFKIQPEVDDDDADDVEQDTSLTSCSKRPAKSTSAVRLPEPSCLCLLGTDETHSMGCGRSQSMLIFHEPEKDRLKIRCLDPKPHEAKMNSALSLSNLSAEAELLWRRSYQRWMANWFACECSRIDLKFPDLTSGIPDLVPFTSILPTPGIFVGNYGAPDEGGHGNEIIFFRYQPDEIATANNDSCGDKILLEGLKITGDPNIPKQKVSMRVFLDQPVRPDRDEQESLEALKETPIVPAENYGELWQTFTLPDDVLFDLDSSVIPKHCLCRFNGEMQLANEGYRNAYFSSSQLVIFDQDLLGVYCFELNDFILFKRVKTGG